MIRIGLFSEDGKLQPLLSSALGREFQVTLKSNVRALEEMISAGACDVVILDLDSNHGSLAERLQCARSIVTSKFPSVVMADDGLRSTAAELVKLGAQGSCRKPPSVRDLKALLCRTHENSSLKRRLELVQQRFEEVTAVIG